MRLRSIMIDPPATTRMVRGLLRANGPPVDAVQGEP